MSGRTAVVLLAIFSAAWGQQRDPFLAPAQPEPPKAAAPEKPLPGLAGVTLDQIQILGVALGGPTGPVALANGPSGSVYFLRPGSRLRDADVVRMDVNGVWFETAGAHAPVYRKVSGS